MAKSYDVTIQFVSSSPDHRSGMTNRTEAIKHAKTVAEKRKGATVEVCATWYERGSLEKKQDVLRFRWDDKVGKVKERT